MRNRITTDFLAQPREDTYKTAKEEKRLEKIRANALVQKTLSDASKKRGGYVAPEMDEEIISDKKIGRDVGGNDEDENNKKKRLSKGEGGLEVIVDVQEKRVRIRRCNMNASTVVKEESEAILLRAILKNIEVIENDYRILMEGKSGKFTIS